jgi:hypothetical protein
MPWPVWSVIYIYVGCCVTFIAAAMFEDRISLWGGVRSVLLWPLWVLVLASEL